MAHFYGTIQGRSGTTSRLGTKTSGLTAEAASWSGKVLTLLYHDEITGLDMALVTLEPHYGNGVHAELYRGPVGEYHPSTNREP